MGADSEVQHWMQIVGLLGAKLIRTSAAHVDSPEHAESSPVSVILSNDDQKERSLESFRT